VTRLKISVELEGAPVASLYEEVGEEEAAHILGIRPNMLRTMRHNGRSPRVNRLRPEPMYRLIDLLRYAKKQVRLTF
jgi:hypothetical protein